MKIPQRYLLSGLVIAAATAVFADDHAALDAIYEVVVDAPVTRERVASHYADNVIHVGRDETPPVISKDVIMEARIDPFVEMLDSGQVSWSGSTYAVRRVISGDMPNDVGCPHSRIACPDGRKIEQLQKFSWVFVKENNAGRVPTDVDATMAPPSVLEELEPQFTIGGSNNNGEVFE